MARTNIYHVEKRNELLAKLWDIFMSYGYENTTLSLIIKEIGISKGAFYHYFPTKEACADAAVDMYAKVCFKDISLQIEDNILADEKLKNLILACSMLFKKNEKNIENINSPSNAIFHQKLMVALVKELAPLYANVISQGVEENIFNTKYPLETAEMILTLSNFFFDIDLFRWRLCDMQKKIVAFEELLTLTLRAKPDTFKFLHNLS
ncbi:TetR/AcrR family transcriptional regulator [Hathewaya histolytica]|uniref:TetR/AcrR family transcriptional regulator n=1 Tax=Hathewaya histolytica TaxID=1498 RepID=UPI003B67C012